MKTIKEHNNLINYYNLWFWEEKQNQSIKIVRTY